MGKKDREKKAAPQQPGSLMRDPQCPRCEEKDKEITLLNGRIEDLESRLRALRRK